MPSPSFRRDHLIRALQAELVGPYDLHGKFKEVLTTSPSRCYLTGFLAPESQEDPQSDLDGQEELARGDDRDDAES